MPPGCAGPDRAFGAPGPAVTPGDRRPAVDIPCIAQNRGGPLIGLGGTIRNLAKIEIACHECPLNTLHGFVLTRGSVEASVQLFRENPLAKRREIAGLSRDRGDIILAGALTVLGVLDRLGIDSLTSPRRACARVCSSSTSGMTCPIR